MSGIVSSPNHEVQVLILYLVKEQVECSDRNITFCVASPITSREAPVFRGINISSAAHRFSADCRGTFSVEQVRMQIGQVQDFEYLLVGGFLLRLVGFAC